MQALPLLFLVNVTQVQLNDLIYGLHIIYRNAICVHSNAFRLQFNFLLSVHAVRSLIKHSSSRLKCMISLKLVGWLALARVKLIKNWQYGRFPRYDCICCITIECHKYSPLCCMLIASIRQSRGWGLCVGLQHS